MREERHELDRSHHHAGGRRGSALAGQQLRAAARGATAGGGGRRAADVVLPAGGVLLCGFLLLHTGWRSLLVAGLVGAVGVLVARTPRHAERI